MTKTEADLKLAIAAIESVEQHLDVVKKAIAHDAVCRDQDYRHVFQGMIDELRRCREKLAGIGKD